ncbi:polymorphic toxin type 46 domain-containing protein [Pseudomonas sp. 10-1B]|nr:polymorphic toxin type 46 domain-containing protein [Pseudomonas sp. 10-1B]
MSLRSISAPPLDDWFVKVQPFQALGRARQMTSTEKSLFKLVSPGD